jgi:pilus assembly protein Flp/PilA
MKKLPLDSGEATALSHALPPENWARTEALHCSQHVLDWQPLVLCHGKANRSATKRELKTDPARGCLTSVGRGCPELESRSAPLKDRRGATMVQQSYIGLKSAIAAHNTPVEPSNASSFAVKIHRALKFALDNLHMKAFRKFLADETGATAIEYGLIAAGISLAIIAAVNGLGTNVKTKFTSINTSLK